MNIPLRLIFSEITLLETGRNSPPSLFKAKKLFMGKYYEPEDYQETPPAEFVERLKENYG